MHGWSAMNTVPFYLLKLIGEPLYHSILSTVADHISVSQLTVAGFFGLYVVMTASPSNKVNKKFELLLHDMAVELEHTALDLTETHIYSYLYHWLFEKSGHPDDKHELKHPTFNSDKTTSHISTAVILFWLSSALCFLASVDEPLIQLSQ